MGPNEPNEPIMNLASYAIDRRIAIIVCPGRSLYWAHRCHHDVCRRARLLDHHPGHPFELPRLFPRPASLRMYPGWLLLLRPHHQYRGRR